MSVLEWSLAYGGWAISLISVPYGYFKYRQAKNFKRQVVRLMEVSQHSYSEKKYLAEVGIFED